MITSRLVPIWSFLRQDHWSPFDIIENDTSHNWLTSLRAPHFMKPHQPSRLQTCSNAQKSWWNHHWWMVRPWPPCLIRPYLEAKTTIWSRWKPPRHVSAVTSGRSSASVSGGAWSLPYPYPERCLVLNIWVCLKIWYRLNPPRSWWALGGIHHFQRHPYWFTCVCMYMCICVYMYICIYVYMYICIYVYMYVCMYICII